MQDIQHHPIWPYWLKRWECTSRVEIWWNTYANETSQDLRSDNLVVEVTENKSSFLPSLSFFFLTARRFSVWFCKISFQRYQGRRCSYRGRNGGNVMAQVGAIVEGLSYWGKHSDINYKIELDPFLWWKVIFRTNTNQTTRNPGPKEIVLGRLPHVLSFFFQFV